MPIILPSKDYNYHTQKLNATTALAASLASSVYGQTVTFTATVSASPPGAHISSGAVTFKDGGDGAFNPGSTATPFEILWLHPHPPYVMEYSAALESSTAQDLGGFDTRDSTA